MTDPIIFKAIKIASILHKSQFRKDNTPYIEHPVAVASIVALHSKDPEIIAAAYLHDVLEDVAKSVYSHEQFRADFGPRVYKIVKDMSDKLDPISDADEISSWKQRKVKIIQHMQTVGLDTLLVFCADKIHNTHDLVSHLKENGEATWKLFHASKEEELWYHQSCLELVWKRMPGELAEELAFYEAQLRKL